MTEPTRPDLTPVSVRPDGPPLAPTFLLGARDRRLGGALGASLVSHLAVTGLLLLIISLAPEPVYQAFNPDRTSYNIVWLPQEGPGGGGGGGGNQSLELPPPVELQGEEQAKLSVPAEEPEPAEPDPEPEEPELTAETLRIPAVAVAVSTESRRGLLEGLMAQGPTTSQGSGVGGGAGRGDGTGIGAGRGSGLGPGEGGGVGGGVYRPGSGIIIPRPVNEVKPRYTAEAMRAKVQGVVWLECVVLPDGTVGDVKITKSLDPVFGLDEEAVKAARQWRFIPGTRYGTPVPVLVTIELSFTLR